MSERVFILPLWIRVWHWLMDFGMGTSDFPPHRQ